MSAKEGIARLHWLGSRIATLGSLTGILLWFTILYIRHSFGLVELLLLILVPIILGALVRALAWVLEGFFLSDR